MVPKELIIVSRSFLTLMFLVLTFALAFYSSDVICIRTVGLCILTVGYFIFIYRYIHTNKLLICKVDVPKI